MDVNLDSDDNFYSQTRFFDKRSCEDFHFPEYDYVLQDTIKEPPYPCVFVDCGDGFFERTHLEYGKKINIDKSKKQMIYNFTAFGCDITFFYSVKK